ncbi:MAG: Rieske 2Fe-2S domain-containing protein [Candidatus Thiothrix singaporensis]|uniref:Rieske 2Fe-2S domain-containing protein n=1 Tax=Candidatus Thiothrix singaporensis TaxID=2799669 RepID=A0A7L6AT90_9GAMM|nr:MAG: Rieske 2Fe-2S domain-containing protein [Candidatus Thiothrix singaporensis]
MSGMTAQKRQKVLVCAADALQEKQFLLVEVSYRGEPHSAIVLRYAGSAFAYLNQCVHMPRPLTCERDAIFDAQANRLRCSMHGIVYDPQTGESLSALCQGERLQALRLEELDGKLFITDKRVAPRGNK